MSDHIKGLEPKINRLHESMSRLVADNRAETLLKIIRRPGWTTPQEAALVHAMLDHLNAQVDAVGTAHTALMGIAERIGR